MWRYLAAVLAVLACSAAHAAGVELNQGTVADLDGLPGVGPALSRRILEARQRFGLINLIRVPMGSFTFIGPLLVLPFSKNLFPVVMILLAVGPTVALAQARMERDGITMYWGLVPAAIASPGPRKR